MYDNLWHFCTNVQSGALKVIVSLSNIYAGKAQYNKSVSNIIAAGIIKADIFYRISIQYSLGDPGGERPQISYTEAYILIAIRMCMSNILSSQCFALRAFRSGCGLFYL